VQTFINYSVNFHTPVIFNFNTESVSQKVAICFPAFNSKYVNTSSSRQVAYHSFLTFSAGSMYTKKALTRFCLSFERDNQSPKRL